MAVCCAVLQKRLQTAQVFGAKSSIRGQELGTASSVAFTPLQGLEIVNPLAAERKQDVSHPSSLGWTSHFILQFLSLSLPPQPPNAGKRWVLLHNGKFHTSQENLIIPYYTIRD